MYPGRRTGRRVWWPYEGKRAPFPIREPSSLVISDDTQLTLATCEAIIESQVISPEYISTKFISWYRSGQIKNVGSSTKKALSELSAGAHWALSGRRGEMAAGNGAAMRIAPLAFCLGLHDPAKRRIFRDVCRITHHSEEAYAGALAVAVAIRAACRGSWRPRTGLLELVITATPDTSVRDRLVDIRRDYSAAPLSEIAARFGATGYVVDSVPLAIAGAERVWGLGFKGVLAQLVLAAGDTDTIAAIAGQIMGALIGKSELPTDFVRMLVGRAQIEERATAFGRTVEDRFAAEIKSGLVAQHTDGN